MIRNKLILSVLLTLPLCVTALPSDQQAPITIDAQTVDFSRSTGKGVYQGQVQVDQGTSHLTADKAYTFMDQQNDLTKARALGTNKQLAHFWTLLEQGKDILHAHANEIIYLPKQNKIILIGHAKVQQGKDIFTAPKIEYDTLHQHVISSADQSNRTRIVIHQSSTKGKS